MVPEEWMKQMQMMQAQLAAMGGAAPPDLLAAWQQQVQAQAQMAALAAAQMQIDPNMAVAFALQQQQQQSADVMANLQAAAAQNVGMIQFMHPAMANTHPAALGLYDPNTLGE